MVNENQVAAVGDRVLVPWGLDEIEGEIVEVYITGLGPRARVRLDDEDGSTVTVPLDSLLLHRPRTRTASGLEYERQVGSALRRASTELNLSGSDLSSIDTGADLEFALGKRRLLVQVKNYAGAGRVSTDAILTVAGLADNHTAVLLVADVPLAPTARQRLEQLARGRTRV